MFRALIIFIAVLAVPPLWAQSPGAEIARANKLREQGNSAEARKIYEAVLPRLREQGPSDDLAKVLLNLSDIANAAGEYDRAAALAHEGGDIYERMHDVAGRAGAFNDAGFALLNAGEYPQAAHDLELALDLNRSTHDLQTATLILNNLGNVYYYQARYSDAYRSYQSAMQNITRSANEPWAPALRQLTLYNLATIYQKLGSDERAIQTYMEIKQFPHLTPEEYARTETNLGVLYRHLGDPEKALASYQDARKHYIKERDADAELNTLKNTGIVLGLDLGRLPEALRVFDESRALARKISNRREELQAMLYQGEILLRMQRLAEAQSDFTSALSLAGELGTGEEEWKALYGLGRIALRQNDLPGAEARFRQAVEGIEKVRSSIQLTRLKADFFGNKRSVYDALIALLLERNDAAGAFEFMERSRARLFQDRFSGNATPPTVSLEAVQHHLEPGSALVEFWTGPAEIAAVVVTPKSVAVEREPRSAQQNQQLLRFVSGLPGTLSGDPQTDSRLIASFLPGSLFPKLVRTRQLTIVPDGVLGLLPFELASGTSGRPLIEDYEINYLPSAALLLRERMGHAAQLRWPWQQQLLAFGAPAVAHTGGENPLPVDTDPLPNSAQEIRAIAAMSAGGKHIFIGADDRKTAFFTATRSPAPLLHVSTHAIADTDDPELSRLLFSGESPGEPGTYVFLKELYDLDLRNTSLATLSACDTERGRLVAGEGVQAFSRALLSAGSRSTLTTLWRVSDQPTEEFMKLFYYYLLKEHRSKTEALRLAKLKFLHSGGELSSPQYWAAFVLNGEGNAPVPRFIPWQVLAGGVAVLALVLVGFKIKDLKGALSS